MKNISKFVQVLSLALFTTTAASIFGINGSTPSSLALRNQQEKTILECDSKLEKIQNHEASWFYTIAKLFSYEAFPVILGMVLGSAAYFRLTDKDNQEEMANIISLCAGAFGVYSGQKFQSISRQHIEEVEKTKKNATKTKEEAMKAFQESIKKKNN